MAAVYPGFTDSNTFQKSMSESNKVSLEQLRHGLVTRAASETEQIARDFAAFVPNNKVLALHGSLGTGKTTFIRGLARAWEIEEPITSPTFNLFTLYQGSRQMVHLDAYRLTSSTDFDALMIDDFLSSPWCLAIEWPEKIGENIPEDAWHLYFDIDPSTAHCFRLTT